MATQHLWIPDWLPASVNELMKGVRIRIRRKKKDREMVESYAFTQGIEKAVGSRRVSVVFVYPKGKRFHDVDALFKSLLDSLVRAELLVDDDREYCQLGEWRAEKGERSNTLVILEDLEPITLQESGTQREKPRKLKETKVQCPSQCARKKPERSAPSPQRRKKPGR